MQRFHLIEDAAVVLISKGVYRQAKVYRRGDALYAGHGTGFIRLFRHGTSIPSVRVLDLDVPNFAVSYDVHDKAVAK